MDLHVEEKIKHSWQEDPVHKKIVKSYTPSKIINNNCYAYNHINMTQLHYQYSPKLNDDI